MDKTELLRELEGLTHDARMARLVEIGRQSQHEAGLAALLDELENGDGFARRLALQACYGSGDGARVRRLVDDPSRVVRRMALRLAPVACDDAQLLEILHAANPRGRRALLCRLAKRHRTAPIDAFIERALQSGAPDIEPLLSLASLSLVERTWPLVRERAAPHDWARLARRQPHFVCDILWSEIAAREELDHEILSRANATLGALAEHAPDDGVRLLGALLERSAPAQVEWESLKLRRPREVAALLLNCDEAIAAPGALAPRAHRLESAMLLEVLAKQEALLGEPQVWLERLDAASRRTVYEFAGRGWRNAEGVVATDLIALLPRAEREAEARRHGNLPALATRPEQRLPYAAFLPWREAREVVAPFLGNPDPGLRSVAHRALAGCARYERAHLGDLLTIVEQRGNEQDPVRGAMLLGLAVLPPCVWQDEHLATLGVILRQALDAADLSQATAYQTQLLVVKLLPRHAQWAAQWMATLVKERGTVSLSGLEARLSDDDVRRIAPALEPVLRAWRSRERDGFLIAVAHALGKRVRVWPALQEMLAEIAREGMQHQAKTALGLLKEHFPAGFAELVPQLLAADGSWATQPVVHRFLHRRRQDLITDYLGRRAYKGKFSTGGTRFVLPLRNGFARWLPVQQEIFAETLTEVVDDRERDNPAKIVTVRQLAALPDVTPRVLWRLARRQSAIHRAVRDAALRGLARLDAGQGVPELIEALEDERANIAIYGLRTALLEMPPQRALQILRAAPAGKVTVAKEIVRLLGDLPGGAGFEDLQGWAGRDLHRDVRIALLRALWQHLEEPRAWEILEAAARSDDAAVAAMAARTTAPRLTGETKRRLARLLAALLGHTDAKVRLDVLHRCHAQPPADDGKSLRMPLFGALDSPLSDEYRAAAQAVFAIYPREAALIGEAARRLMPRRRVLDSVLLLFVEALQANSRLREAGRAIVAVLGADALCAPWRARIGVRALATGELVVLLEEMESDSLLHVESLRAVCDEMVPPSPTVPDEWAWVLEDEGYNALLSARRAPEELERALAGHDSANLRRIALAALVAAARDRRGWTDKRIARLAQFQNDPSPLVASAAQFTFPPDAGEPDDGEGKT